MSRQALEQFAPVDEAAESTTSLPADIADSPFALKANSVTGDISAVPPIDSSASPFLTRSSLNTGKSDNPQIDETESPFSPQLKPSLETRAENDIGTTVKPRLTSRN